MAWHMICSLCCQKPSSAIREEREGALRKIEKRTRSVSRPCSRMPTFITPPGVLQKLEQTHGYPARPPLYVGYELSAFDDNLLEPQKKTANAFRGKGRFGYFRSR